MSTTKKDPISITIAIPVYQGSATLKRAIDSVFSQLTAQTKIIILDDNKKESEEEIVKTKNIVHNYHSKKISYVRNEQNLGCQQSIAKLATLTTDDVILYLAQDDIFSSNAVALVRSAFTRHPEICLVTRPYFWFETNYKQPVRAVQPVSSTKDTIISLYDGAQSIKAIFGTVGQISGLGYKRKLLKPFHNDLFPGHIYPIAEMVKEHPCLMLHSYTVAVSITSSQTRQVSSVFATSPTKQWIKMFTKIYKGKQYRGIRQRCIAHIATHYEGLIQIKNYGTFGAVLREIKILITQYPLNVIQPGFWFYTFLVLFTPRWLLRRFTDWYKRTIVAKSIPNIDFIATI